MRPTRCWSMWIGLLLLRLCGLVTLPHSLGAEETARERLAVAVLWQAMPSHGPRGAARTTAADPPTREGPPLQRVSPPPYLAVPPSSMPRTPVLPAASAPPEDPIISDCRYVGFQTEWVASKRDAGLPLVEALASYRRVFALDLPWQNAIAGAMGTLVYRAPQRSPAELRQAMEAACLAHPLLWTERRSEW